MFKVLALGKLTSKKYVPDYSVLAQQIFSCLYPDPRGLRFEEICEICSPLAEHEVFDKIVSHLIEKGWLVSKAGKIYATEKLMNKGERTYSLKHS